MSKYFDNTLTCIDAVSSSMKHPLLILGAFLHLALFYKYHITAI